MKKFFGGIFIEKEKLEMEGIKYPIKLEYYKNINEDEGINKNQEKFGISITKTEYKPDDVKIESKEIKHLTNDEKVANNILATLKENQVTPISLQDIVYDLVKTK